MRHPFVLFLLAIVLPSMVVMVGSERAAVSAQRSLQAESATRIARLTLGATEHAFLTAASDADSTPDPAESPPDAVAAASGAVGLVGRLTGARLVVVQGDEVLASSDSTQAADEGSTTNGGVFVTSTSEQISPPLRVFATNQALPAPVSNPVRVVMLLLCLLPALTSWLLAHRSRWTKKGGRRRKRDGAAMALLTAVPVTAAVLLAVQVRQDFDDNASGLLARDLTRGLAVVEALGLSNMPDRVLELTSFEAAIVTDGAITVSTLDAPAPEVAALPDPPPSFTTSGLVDTPIGRSHYVSRRLTPTSFLTVLAAPPTEIRAALDRTTRWLLIGLGLWLAVALAKVFARRTRPAGEVAGGDRA